jgi:hypothetical protein
VQRPNRAEFSRLTIGWSARKANRGQGTDESARRSAIRGKATEPLPLRVGGEGRATDGYRCRILRRQSQIVGDIREVLFEIRRVRGHLHGVVENTHALWVKFSNDA